MTNAINLTKIALLLLLAYDLVLGSYAKVRLHNRMTPNGVFVPNFN